MNGDKKIVGIMIDHPVFCLVGLSMILSATVQAIEIIMEPISTTIERKTRRKYLMRERRK